MKGCRVLVYTVICAKGNKNVGFRAPARGISAEMINMKLEDQLRGVIRLKHFSRKTEETDVGWYRRFVLWHGKRLPREMGAAEVEAFLTHLAVRGKLGSVCESRLFSKFGGHDLGDLVVCVL